MWTGTQLCPAASASAAHSTAELAELTASMLVISDISSLSRPADPHRRSEDERTGGALMFQPHRTSGLGQSGCSSPRQEQGEQLRPRRERERSPQAAG